MSAETARRDILERLDASVCHHEKFEVTRLALSEHIRTSRPPRCVLCGPPFVGKTTLVNEIFGGDDEAIVVPAPTGASSGQQNPAMELLEAACKAGGAPMVDGFIDSERSSQPPLPFLAECVSPPRRFGRSWESSEQVALRGFKRMVKNRGHRHLVLDGAERMVDVSATRKRIAWLLHLADFVGIGLVLVCRDHAAASIVGDGAYGGEFALFRLQRYSSPEDEAEVAGFHDAVTMLLSKVPEIEISDLNVDLSEDLKDELKEKMGERLGKLYRHSLGCFGLLHEHLRKAITTGTLKGRKAGSRTMTLTQDCLDGAARPIDGLARLLSTLYEGERRITEAGQLDVTGEALDVSLGSYEVEPVMSRHSRTASKGLHDRRPGDRNPTREVGNSGRVRTVLTGTSEA